MSDLPTCERCGGDFRVELCAVHEDDERGRVEAYLCWDCRGETVNKPLGLTVDREYPRTGDTDE